MFHLKVEERCGETSVNWGKWSRVRFCGCGCAYRWVGVKQKYRKTHLSARSPAAIGDFLSSKSWIAVLAKTTLLFSDPETRTKAHTNTNDKDTQSSHISHIIIPYIISELTTGRLERGTLILDTTEPYLWLQLTTTVLRGRVHPRQVRRVNKRLSDHLY